MSICLTCEAVGLPILFLRHSALAFNESLAPFGARMLEPHEASIKALKLPPLKYSKYVLRMLRSMQLDGQAHAGYLHIFHETKPVDHKSPWEVFRVDEAGALIPATQPAFVSVEPVVCKSKTSHPHDTRVYCVPNADKASGIWVAYSANLWSDKQREANKAKPEVMQRIDISAVRGGNFPDDAIKANEKSFEKYIAEFVLKDFEHGGHRPTFGFRSSIFEAGKQVRVMEHKADPRSIAERSTKPAPVTAGKAFAFVLRDPVGTATDLGDIVMARHMQGLEYGRSQAQPLAALQALDYIKKGMFDGQMAALQTRLPLTRVNLVMNDPQSTPLVTGESFPDKKPLPVEADYANWVQMGVMSFQSFKMGQDARHFPSTARWYPLTKYQSDGLVIAPRSDQAALGARNNSSKINRLHNAAAAESYRSTFKQEIDKHETSVSNYDSDRSA